MWPSAENKGPCLKPRTVYLSICRQAVNASIQHKDIMHVPLFQDQFSQDLSTKIRSIDTIARRALKRLLRRCQELLGCIGNVLHRLGVAIHLYESHLIR